VAATPPNPWSFSGLRTTVHGWLCDGHGPYNCRADEPTGNLDSDTSLEVIDLMERLNRDSGQTFVIVTHDPAVSARAHRVIRMQDGSIVNGTPP
jgi:predicted ABC-type transport system involved in lysophospholipase L1 biosynthesis ATPase subunit